MTPFTYARAADPAAAVREGALAATRYLGGGTNLVDLMREGIERPGHLIDVTGLATTITEAEDGGLLIGAGVKNGVLAADMRVRTRYPMLSRALLTGASAQIRNMATVGGNILQRTRCTYFYDAAAACNKRSPGDGCDAREGFNRIHAILGASPACVATHPSDMCVALAALDAVVHVVGVAGARRVPLVALHRLPGDTPEQETELEAGDLITAIELPAAAAGTRSAYRKVRDRASYAFALVSLAARLDLAEDGTVRDVALALGGVAHRPWRATLAEACLRGRPTDETAFREAARAELAAAVPLRDNGFKIALAERLIVAVLGDLAGERA
ncbi:MAG: xanthine dehydrogenase family protein subunit M [Sphingomonas sp.]